MLVFAEWVTHKVVVSESCEESVRVRKVALVSAPELVTTEVPTPNIPGETVGVGMEELVCAP